MKQNKLQPPTKWGVNYEPERGSGRTTSIALLGIGHAMRNPGDAFEVRDHRSGTHSHMERTVHALIAKLGLVHMKVTRDIRGVVIMCDIMEEVAPQPCPAPPVPPPPPPPCPAPPLGLQPRTLFEDTLGTMKMQRVKAIQAALRRYAEEHKIAPVEWLDELADLLGVKA